MSLKAVTAEVASSSLVVPANSFQTTCADFGETIEDPKGHVFAPFLVSLFALADLPLLLRGNVI